MLRTWTKVDCKYEYGIYVVTISFLYFGGVCFYKL